MDSKAPSAFEGMPVVRRAEAFDHDSGSALERLVFKHRPVVVAISALLTLILGGIAATRLVVNADFERMMPSRQPFVRNYLANRAELRGLGNVLTVAVENVRGDVYDPAYLETLRRVTDELVLTPGVDRAWVRSLWTPSVRWNEVTEEGFQGGPVMPDDWDGSPAAIESLRRNVARAGVAGTLVALDRRSSLVVVPLIDRDPGTGAPIDYPALSRRLEALRAEVERDGAVRVHVVGFAKLVADLLAGTRAVLAWFAAAAAIAAGFLLAYTRCPRSTGLVVACSATAVLWQLGIVSALGVTLDPFSVLVPFLVFATGVSHGAQKMNGILQDVGRGSHRLVAARYTFRRLFVPGLTALLTDAVGFAVLVVIDVPAIRQMAVTATLGSCLLVFTNLVLLPVLLSYTGVSPGAAERSLRAEDATARGGGPWPVLARLVERRRAAVALAASGLLVALALAAGRAAGPGGAESGAPELRASSRYNQDDAFIAARYRVSDDVFAVLVRTGPDGCLAWRTLVDADRLGWTLQGVPGVRATSSLADAVRGITAGMFEGEPKWLTLSRDQQVLNDAAQQAIARSPELVNAHCSLMPVVAYLSDHGAATLDGVVAAAEAFARGHDDGDRRFLLAAGSAGFEAARNVAVRDARWTMTLLAYAAVALLCWITFRDVRAVLVTLVPLAATSVLCDALMAAMGVGLKLSTLPVIALGVGIPDFALYLLSIQLAHQRAGAPLDVAYRRALGFTGKVVVLVSVTLAAGVVTWAASPIRLQADMGVLLTFMFLGNMVAALVLVPALSRFLLADVGVAPAERARRARSAADVRASPSP